MSKPTVNKLTKMKERKEKICMTTAYDYCTMRHVDKSDIDIVLVGDSASMIMLGNQSTIPISMDEIIIFCKAVSNAAENTFVVGDMPFMSYEISPEKAIENAGRIIKEGGVDAVKLEGGKRLVRIVKAIIDAGILVMGHVGLTPQTATMLGGYRVQGKDELMAEEILNDAKALEEAGVFSIIVEAVPAELANVITKNTNIPIIGIGAGPHCDGQVLVLQDMLGMYDKFTPKFVKQYANLGDQIKESLNNYSREVRDGVFPSEEYTYK